MYERNSFFPTPLNIFDFSLSFSSSYIFYFHPFSFLIFRRVFKQHWILLHLIGWFFLHRGILLFSKSFHYFINSFYFYSFSSLSTAFIGWLFWKSILEFVKKWKKNRFTFLLCCILSFSSLTSLSLPRSSTIIFLHDSINVLFRK